MQQGATKRISYCQSVLGAAFAWRSQGVLKKTASSSCASMLHLGFSSVGSNKMQDPAAAGVSVLQTTFGSVGKHVLPP